VNEKLGKKFLFPSKDCLYRNKTIIFDISFLINPHLSSAGSPCKMVISRKRRVDV
jgi:hypothetical protein